MQEKRRLRKADREIVESAAAKAAAALRPTFDEIERKVIDDHLSDVPEGLRGEFVQEFMNQLGGTLFTAFDLALETKPADPSEGS